MAELESIFFCFIFIYSIEKLSFLFWLCRLRQVLDFVAIAAIFVANLKNQIYTL